MRVALRPSVATRCLSSAVRFGSAAAASPRRRQLPEYRLADVVDTIGPVGCIMAGDWQRDAPWRRKKAKKQTRVDEDIESDSVIE